jgi:hypothetical protein
MKIERLYTEQEVLNIIEVSFEEGMRIQRTINDTVNIPATRIKKFQKQVIDNYKNLHENNKLNTLHKGHFPSKF